MRERVIPLSDPAAWRRALEGVPHGFAHGFAHCSAMALASGCPTFLYCAEDGDDRLLCPFAERRTGDGADLVTPYGFSGFTGRGRWQRLAPRWRAFATERGYVCAYVALNPLFAAARDLALGPGFRHTAVHVLDLARAPEALHAGLSANVRAGLRAWEKTGARLVYERDALVPAFLDLYPAFVRSLGASAVYDFGREALAALLAARDAFLVGAERGGRIEAIAVFGATPFAADYLFNASLAGARDHSRALVWSGIKTLARRGIPLLNLGGGVREGDGLDAFKGRFGGRRIPTEALKLVFDRAAYERLCRRAGADPDDSGGYFPAYRRIGLREAVA